MKDLMKRTLPLRSSKPDQVPMDLLLFHSDYDNWHELFYSRSSSQTGREKEINLFNYG